MGDQRSHRQRQNPFIGSSSFVVVVLTLNPTNKQNYEVRRTSTYFKYYFPSHTKPRSNTSLPVTLPVHYSHHLILPIINTTSLTMGVQRQENMGAVELTTLAGTKGEPFNNSEQQNIDYDGSSAATAPSSLDTSIHSSSSSSNEEISSKAILEIPPYWIYGSLPTDKEYGRWIRSQLTEHAIDQSAAEKVGSKHQPRWKHSRPDITMGMYRENPWNRFQQDLQDAVAKGIALAANLPERCMLKERRTGVELSCLSS